LASPHKGTQPPPQTVFHCAFLIVHSSFFPKAAGPAWFGEGNAGFGEGNAGRGEKRSGKQNYREMPGVLNGTQITCF
jgi:hypothetical protein